jgi:hypothetical protein
MRAIEAETFSGYGGLRQVELPKPQPAKDRVLVRLTAGVTPLDTPSNRGSAVWQTRLGEVIPNVPFRCRKPICEPPKQAQGNNRSNWFALVVAETRIGHFTQIVMEAVK